MNKSILLFFMSIIPLLCSCSVNSKCQEQPKIKILVSGYYGALRDCNELKKSGLFEINKCSTSGSLLDNRGRKFFQDTFYWLDAHKTAADVGAELTDKLNSNPQVMIMLQHPEWKLYPANVQDKILHNVENDMVLSLFAPAAQLRKKLALKWKKSSIEFDFRKYGKNDKFNFEIYDYGKGKTVYFNFDFYEYFELRKANRENEIREFFRNYFIRHLDFSLSKHVCDNNDIPVAKTKVFHFNDKKTTYTGVIFDKNLYESSTKYDVKIPVQSTGHLYDVINQKYLGYGNTAQIEAESGYIALIACTPKKITAPVLTAPHSIRQGEKFKCSIQMTKQPQTVRVSVISPLNNKIEHYGKIIYLADGKGTFEFCPALNDICGEWKVTVEDVVSGLKTNTTFLLN